VVVLRASGRGEERRRPDGAGDGRVPGIRVMRARLYARSSRAARPAIPSTRPYVQITGTPYASNCRSWLTIVAACR
jgi:hypothetical protein